MWVEQIEHPGLERFHGDEESDDFVVFAVGVDLLEFSAVVSSSKVKRSGNPKPDRRAQKQLQDALEIEGGLASAVFLQHCVADMLAGAVEDERATIEALDERVRE